MNVVVFEDAQVSRLYPITLGRPAYAITCGSFRLLDWLKRLDLPIQGVVRPHMTLIQSLDYPELSGPTTAGPTSVGSSRSGSSPAEPSTTLFVNARLLPSRTVFETLRLILDRGCEGYVQHAGELAVALYRDNGAEAEPNWDIESVMDYLQPLDNPRLTELEHELPLFRYPHDIVRYNMQVLAENLEYRLSTGAYQEIADGVFVGEQARLGQYVVTNTSAGPVILESRATTGPFCYLSGPAYVGYGAKLIEHAAVKDAVSIGHTTKIGGEVEASVIEPYTNKQHHGFLGHSYLGSWINLGAGTCNSDLKNTYGTVNVDHQGEKVATGMQFVGCIMGDYSKTAINTSIFTGKTIGACSMLYGFVTTNVPSFVNYARLFGQVTELPPEVMIATQQRMFRRRQVDQRPCDVQLLHDMYELSREEREVVGEPLAL